MTDKPFSEYAQRNGGPILEVLLREFVASSRVLEIGSGTGQHAAQFAGALSHLSWQTSDLIENHAGIRAWVEDAELSNLFLPLPFDVLDAELAAESFDAVYSSNTAHIMSIAAVERMFDIVGKALLGGGVFCLYGPFRQDGKFNTDSNQRFHNSLQSRDAQMGIRDIEKLDEFGSSYGLDRERLYAMPANNHLAVWRKASQ